MLKLTNAPHMRFAGSSNARSPIATTLPLYRGTTAHSAGSSQSNLSQFPVLPEGGATARATVAVRRGWRVIGVRVTVDDPGAFNIPLSATGRGGRSTAHRTDVRKDILNDEVAPFPRLASRFCF